MLRRVLTRATFYDGFITMLGIGVAVFMLYPFAYYFRPIDHRRTAVILSWMAGSFCKTVLSE